MADKELVLVVRVKLVSGNKLVAKDLLSSDPYCRVWVGPKGLIEAPDRGWFASTVQPHTLHPTWGPKPKHSQLTKDLFKQLGKDFMTPLSDPNQDCWNFLWREGDVIHVQIWDRDKHNYQKDDYMGNVSYQLDFDATGPQNVTTQVHNGPIGQIRSKSKVSGNITIEWEWMTKTDQLKIDKWIPLLRKLTFEDERRLSFVRQEDLLPHMSVPVARFVLSKIEKGEVKFPTRSLSFNAENRFTRRQTITTGLQDWQNEFCDEDDEDDDLREPDGQLFVMLGKKMISLEFYSDETISTVKRRLADEAGVSNESLSFSYEKVGCQIVVGDDVSVLDFADATVIAACTEKSVDEIAKILVPPAPAPPPLPPVQIANSGDNHGDYFFPDADAPLGNPSMTPPQMTPPHTPPTPGTPGGPMKSRSFTFADEMPPMSEGQVPNKPARRKKSQNPAPPGSPNTSQSSPALSANTASSSLTPPPSKSPATPPVLPLSNVHYPARGSTTPPPFSQSLNNTSFPPPSAVPVLSPRGPRRGADGRKQGSHISPHKARPTSPGPGQVRRSSSNVQAGMRGHTRQNSIGARGINRTGKKMGLITEMAALVINQDFEKMARVLGSLSMEDLVTCTPILVAVTSEEIINLIKKKSEESEHFATRVRMIQNTRIQFSHLNPVIGHVPLSAFLEKFLSPSLSFKQGDSWKISSVHPITNEPFDEVKVVKVFSSLARPSILVFSNKGETLDPGVLFKQGEDLYNETCLQVMFKFMNELWESLLPESLRPKIFGLRELPGSVERGFLETVADVRDLEIVERGNFELIEPENDENFVRTSCGWILASYFLGLSDRHRENTLVRITDGSAIPIDFGFILGNQPPSYNTFCITVSGDMYKYLLRKNMWETFSMMFLAGFWAVRTKAQEFVKLAVHLFQGTDRNLETSAMFITHRMRMGEDMQKAMRKTYGNLRHAPICFFTKKKIEGHARSKKIPARDDFIGSLARKIGANAAKPEKAEEDTGGDVHTAKHLHPGKVTLNLPTSYPAHYPGDFVKLMVGLQRDSQKK